MFFIQHLPENKQEITPTDLFYEAIITLLAKLDSQYKKTRPIFLMNFDKKNPQEIFSKSNPVWIKRIIRRTKL